MQTILISNNLPDAVTSRLLLPTSISIRAHFPSPQTAFTSMAQLRPELILIDLEWLSEGGEALIQRLQTYCPEVVFRSASGKYGLRVVTNGIKTHLEQIQLTHLKDLRSSSLPRPYKLALPTAEGFTFVKIQNILQVQALGQQTSIFFCDGMDCVISRPFAVFASLLSNYSFGWVEPTLLVNLMHVKMTYQTQQFILSWENKRNWTVLPIFQADIEERIQLMAWTQQAISLQDQQRYDSQQFPF